MGGGIFASSVILCCGSSCVLEMNDKVGFDSLSLTVKTGLILKLHPLSGVVY